MSYTHIFKTDNKAQVEKTSDFISFNKSPCSNFTPPHYSSPLKADNYRKKKWKDNRKNQQWLNHSNNSSGSFSENSYNNSYTSRRNSSQGCNHSNYYNKNYSDSTSAQQYLSQGSNNFNNYSGNFAGSSHNSNNAKQNLFQTQNTTKYKTDITCYVHPSFMEDPWKRLEEEYLQKNK